jgi:predicted MFS family arabinose efflux permease
VAPAPGAPHAPPLPVALLAVAAGLVAANLYYAQPLLGQIARDFGVSAGRAGLVATATQVGYALGLLVIVPLADLAERRRLIVVLAVAAAGALVGAALAPNFAALVAAMLAVGLASVVPQVIGPLAAGLARPEQRGRVVGAVMSGLLVGILLARTASGAAGARVGWRLVFCGAAGLMLVLAAVLRRLLPESRPAGRGSYGALMRSLPAVVRRHPVLRESALAVGLVFGSFSAFWTTLAFHLERPPLLLGSAAAGAFGLAGAAGALGASFVGRLSDRVSPQRTVALGVAAALVGYAVLAALPTSVAGLVLGVVVLDFGVQCAHVSSQARVFALDEATRGRINAVYMVTVFAGGALGSTVGAALWTRAGWAGVCAGGLTMLAAAGVVHLRGYRRRT